MPNTNPDSGAGTTSRSMYVLNFKAPPELIEQLRHHAERSERSMAAEIRLAIRRHLAAQPADGADAARA